MSKQKTKVQDLFSVVDFDDKNVAEDNFYNEVDRIRLFWIRFK